jgi:hypothetical protein
MSNGDLDTQKCENLKTVYSELCVSYRAIDDFRTKLLGFLPLATGAGLFLLVSDKDKMDFARQFFRPMGLFGFIITLGLFSYELYAIKKCGRLIRVGKLLEKDKLLLHLDGQFGWRPRSVAGMINEPFAAGIIYPVVLAAWMFVALVSTWPREGGPQYDSKRALFGAVVVFVVGFVLSILFNLWLKVEGDLENENLRDYSFREVLGEVPIVGRIWRKTSVSKTESPNTPLDASGGSE